MSDEPREFGEDERLNLAAEHHALPDGSYPMPDCDAVGDAIDSFGRAPESHRHELAKLIRRRNAELECGYHLDELETA